VLAPALWVPQHLVANVGWRSPGVKLLDYLVRAPQERLGNRYVVTKYSLEPTTCQRISLPAVFHKLLEEREGPPIGT